MMASGDSQPVRLADYRPPDFAIDSVDLSFDLHADKSRVTARLAVRRLTADPAPLTLDGDDLRLQRLRLDGAELAVDRYRVTPDELVIPDQPSTAFVLEIETELAPSKNTELMGLYLSNGVYCTQCEAEGFRRITYFLDRPDVLSVYTTRIEASASLAPILLANGNPIDSGHVPGTDRHFAVWHDPFPKPSYLFALVAGDLGSIHDSIETASGRAVALGIYCEHGKESRCLYAMDSLKRAMRWDEEAFGREYDLDVFNIVAVSDFNMGAMENKGLNIFNDRFVLADPDTATDADYAHIESVVAHEYFHNWTGNRITCRDWFQLCLKEGLTVYRDQEFSAEMRSRPVSRIDNVRTLKARQFPEDAGPLAHPVRPEIYHEINNFYTATVYEKGAEIVRMLRTLLGSAGFRKGMDLYFERHDGEAATVEDFLAAFADSNGVDLSHFKTWYRQAGTPKVVARAHYDESSSKLTLDFRQSTSPTPGQPQKLPLHIPIRFGLVGEDGNDMGFGAVEGARVTGDVIHLESGSQSVSFSGVSKRPWPSLLREFSAPVQLDQDLSATDLLFMARSDRDAFNRWQAAQTLSMAALVSSATEQGKSDTANHDQLIDALGEVAADENLDAALRAQILTLPTESEIAREVGRNVDPDSIADAREAFRAKLGSVNAGTFRALYDKANSDRAFRPDAEGQGKRALKNAALSLLVAAGPENDDLAELQYRDAGNMTDRMAALGALNHRASQARSECLADFRDRYRDDALVLDKWLALEASAPLSGTAERVLDIMRSDGFSLDNPNRVRALIGSFAAMNQTEFNRVDGVGYELVADVIIQLDRRNPQTAARLLIAFRSWRALEARRRKSAEAALARIADGHDLSSDVKDIITRIRA